MVETFDTDLVVLGGGMGGATTAYAAAEAGQRVVLVEKSSRLGGSASLSGTYVWTATSLQQLRREAPTGDAALQGALVDTFPRLIEFIRDSGVRVSDTVKVLFGEGHQFDIASYLQRASVAVERTGGVVALDTDVTALLVEDDRVVGVRVRDSGGITDLKAADVVLSTGGFQGSKHLMAVHTGDRAARLLHRANPNSTGDGLRLGLGAGAALAGDMATFYGHLVASPLPEFTTRDFVRHVLYLSDRGLLLNVDGERFAREWLGDHRNAQRVAEQKEGRAVLVIDERVRRDSSRAPLIKGGEVYDVFAESARVGARTASAETLEELAIAITAWGCACLDLPGLVRRRAADLAEEQVDAELTGAPFHAIEVRPAITFTEGGLRIDTSARVLDADGHRIQGLHAVGADAGGVFDGGYAGGLAWAGTTALLAVDDILGR